MNKLTLLNRGLITSVKPYGKLRYLQSVNQNNYDILEERVKLFNYLVPSDHVLVQILNALSIDKDLPLEYLYNIVKVESNYLASVYGITSPNNSGKSQNGVYFSNDYLEHITLVSLNTSFEDYLNKPLKEFTPLIPLYNTNTAIDFRPTFDRKINTKAKGSKGIAIFGLDIVELAIGYWKYLNEFSSENTMQVMPSTYNYIGKWPLLNCQMLCNQLALINILSNRADNLHSLANFDYLTGSVAIVKTNKEIYTYLAHINTMLSSSWFNEPVKLLANVFPIFPTANSYPDFTDNDNSYFYQSIWPLLPGMIKIIILTKQYCDSQFKDISPLYKTMVDKFKQSSNNYLNQISDKDMRTHIKELFDKLFLYFK